MLSKEIESRVKQSLAEQDALLRVFGDDDMLLLAQTLTGMVRTAQGLTGKSWATDQATRDVAQILINRHFDTLRSGHVKTVRAGTGAYRAYVAHLEGASRNPDPRPNLPLAKPEGSDHV